MQFQEWWHGLLRKGGWVSVGGAALAGSLLPLIVFVKSTDLQLRHLPFAMAGGALAGAMAAGILLGVDRWRERRKPPPSP